MYYHFEAHMYIMSAHWWATCNILCMAIGTMPCIDERCAWKYCDFYVKDFADQSILLLAADRSSSSPLPPRRSLFASSFTSSPHCICNPLIPWIIINRRLKTDKLNKTYHLPFTAAIYYYWWPQHIVLKLPDFRTLKWLTWIERLTNYRILGSLWLI